MWQDTLRAFAYVYTLLRTLYIEGTASNYVIAYRGGIYCEFLISRRKSGHGNLFNYGLCTRFRCYKTCPILNTTQLDIKDTVFNLKK